MVAVVVVAVMVPAAGRRPVGVAGAHEVSEKTLLDNERVMMIELVFRLGSREAFGRRG
jgi:hypothetical protein